MYEISVHKRLIEIGGAEFDPEEIKSEGGC